MIDNKIDWTRQPLIFVFPDEWTEQEHLRALKRIGALLYYIQGVRLYAYSDYLSPPNHLRTDPEQGRMWWNVSRITHAGVRRIHLIEHPWIAGNVLYPNNATLFNYMDKRLKDSYDK